MRRAVHILACFAYVGHTRRIQSTVGNLPNEELENSNNAFDAPAVHSFVELLQSHSNAPGISTGLARTKQRKSGSQAQVVANVGRHSDLHSRLTRFSGGSAHEMEDEFSNEYADNEDSVDPLDDSALDVQEGEPLLKFGEEDVQALKDMMADPKFQEETRRAAEQIKEVFADPKFQEEAKRVVSDFQAAMTQAGKPSDHVSEQDADKISLAVNTTEKDCDEILSRASQSLGEVEPQNVADALKDVMRMLQDPDCQDSIRKLVSEQMANGDVPDLSKVKQKMRFYAGVLVAILLLAVLGAIQLLRTLLDALFSLR